MARMNHNRPQFRVQGCETVDYRDSGVPIKKLPTGKAMGADDLTNWALRRGRGWSGLGPEHPGKPRKHKKRKSKWMRRWERMNRETGPSLKPGDDVVMDVLRDGGERPPWE